MAFNVPVFSFLCIFLSWKETKITYYPVYECRLLGVSDDKEKNISVEYPDSTITE